MELIPIGEVAHRLGINASALRYYEERGLVRPAARHGGRRMYGPDELRRLAFVQLMQGLGLSLDAASAVLDQPGEQWREVVREQVAVLERLVARAKGAQDFLQHALDCPADHPVRECPYMIETLDQRIAGVTFADQAAEYGHPGAVSSGQTSAGSGREPDAG